MLAKDVQIGATYRCRVGDRLALVTVLAAPGRGHRKFTCQTQDTDRRILATAAKLRPIPGTALAEAEQDWIRAIVTDAVRPERTMDRLRQRFPHAIAMDWQAHLDGVPLAQVERRVDPSQVSPVEVVTSFVEHVTSVPATAQVRKVAEEAVERVRVAEAVR